MGLFLFMLSQKVNNFHLTAGGSNLTKWSGCGVLLVAHRSSSMRRVAHLLQNVSAGGAVEEMQFSVAELIPASAGFGKGRSFGALHGGTNKVLIALVPSSTRQCRNLQCGRLCKRAVKIADPMVTMVL